MGDVTDHSYRVRVYELSDLVERRREEFPAVWVGLRSADRPESRLPAGWVRPMPEFTPETVFSTHKRALRKRDIVATALARRGFTVNPSAEQSRRVYVLELDPEHCPVPGTPWLYVGQTGKPVDDRIRDHLRGKHASRTVARHFVRRRVDLEPERIFTSVWDAIAEETAWGEKLQRQGFVVTGPQNMRAEPSQRT